ncbi:MAG: hypothetical protein LBN39_00330, partial [Planctomycetaceae bacterium]|nr:hypothetical protein [Planctomycetaceae bacterium]
MLTSHAGEFNMLMRSIQVFRRVLFAGTILAAVSANTLFGDDKVAYDYYTSPEGTSYTAVGIRGAAVPSNAVSEVAFLVDTSASQAGQVRHDVLKSLADTLNELPASAKIQVFAMDVETESLTGGFVQNGSPELLNALQKLQRRVPLGAADIAKGLKTVKNSYKGDAAAARRAVVYFGDGRSMARTVSPKEFGQIVDDYTSAKIPFNACAAGIATNLGLLGAFANQTGGNLVDMNAKISEETKKALEKAEATGEQYVNLPDFSKSVGKILAESVNATVVWANPDSYAFPKEWTVYPAKLQPVRSDRETIVVAKTNEAPAPFTLKLKGTIPGNEIELAWNFAPTTEAGVISGSNYLTAVVETAAKDNGLTMPIVGWDTLAVLREGYINHLQDQLDKADAAIKTGNKTQAMKLADNVLRQDPNNGTARRLFVKAEKAAEGVPEPADGSEPSLVDAVAVGTSIASQKIQNEVRQAIVDATQRMSDDPEGAIQTVRLVQAMVRNNTALDPNERNILLDRLGSVQKQAQHTQYVNDFRRQQADENEAAQRERQQTLYDLKTARDKAVQIFDRFNSLMAAKEYKVAEKVSEVAIEMLPSDTEPFTAQRYSEIVSYITEYAELRHQRHIGFVESLMVSERSFIPIPEEPPITYIDPAQWMLLSERRKERWAVSDLSQAGPSERKINKALDNNADIKLDESMTFEDLFTLIKDKNPGINIAVDPKGAGAMGITASSPVVKEPMEYSGIKLRNILKIILSEQDLTYCIKNEVLMVTSVEEADKYMSIKVYPVADLVIPTTPGGGSGGGMMGGMGGMMNGGGMGGGMMGGMGGGMGGMGGGMGGMGGGMYAVPDEVQKDEVQKDAPKSVADVEAAAKQLVEDAKKAENAETFWDNYFSPGKQNEDIVHAAGN